MWLKNIAHRGIAVWGLEMGLWRSAPQREAVPIRGPLGLGVNRDRCANKFDLSARPH
jgi:hypothetical protein